MLNVRYEIGGKCRRGHELTLETLGKQNGGKNNYCKTCQANSTKAYRKAHPEKFYEYQKVFKVKHKDRFKTMSRNSRLKHRFGITNDDYDAMLKSQGGMCAICTSITGSAQFENLFVDHCHTSNKVRGLLCNSCNLGLERFGDDPFLLLRAINYLNNAATNQTDLDT